MTEWSMLKLSANLEMLQRLTKPGLLKLRKPEKSRGYRIPTDSGNFRGKQAGIGVVCETQIYKRLTWISIYSTHRLISIERVEQMETV